MLGPCPDDARVPPSERPLAPPLPVQRPRTSAARLHPPSPARKAWRVHLRIVVFPFTRRCTKGGGVRTPEDNIEIILSDWLEALRRRDFDAIARRMAPEVFW